jgi:hypothetical protein
VLVVADMARAVEGGAGSGADGVSGSVVVFSRPSKMRLRSEVRNKAESSGGGRWRGVSGYIKPTDFCDLNSFPSHSRDKGIAASASPAFSL